MLSKLVGFFKQKINSNIIFPEKPESKSNECFVKQESQKENCFEQIKSQDENKNCNLSK